MQLTINVLSLIRVGVAAVSVLVIAFVGIRTMSKAHRKEPLPIHSSALMFSLLLLNSVLGVLGVPVNDDNSALLIVNIAAIVSLLGALNLLVWRASRGNHA